MSNTSVRNSFLDPTQNKKVQETKLECDTSAFYAKQLTETNT